MSVATRVRVCKKPKSERIYSRAHRSQHFQDAPTSLLPLWLCYTRARASIRSSGVFARIAVCGGKYSVTIFSTASASNFATGPVGAPSTQLKLVGFVPYVLLLTQHEKSTCREFRFHCISSLWPVFNAIMDVGAPLINFTQRVCHCATRPFSSLALRAYVMRFREDERVLCVRQREQMRLCQHKMLT